MISSSQFEYHQFFPHCLVRTRVEHSTLVPLEKKKKKNFVAFSASESGNARQESGQLGWGYVMPSIWESPLFPSWRDNLGGSVSLLSSPTRVISATLRKRCPNIENLPHGHQWASITDLYCPSEPSLPARFSVMHGKCNSNPVGQTRCLTAPCGHGCALRSISIPHLPAVPPFRSVPCLALYIHTTYLYI